MRYTQVFVAKPGWVVPGEQIRKRGPNRALRAYWLEVRQIRRNEEAELAFHTSQSESEEGLRAS